MTQPADHTPPWLSMLAALAGPACVAVLAWWALLPPPAEDSGLATRTVSPCVMDRDGYLRGSVFGAIQRDINLQGTQMRCDGMFRPDGTGIRLVFDEHLDEDEPGLLVIIGIADAVVGESGGEMPANITVIDQEQGLLFATPEEPRCWTSFSEQLELSGTVEEIWRIEGQLYCAGALPALTGSGAITLGDIDFSGMFKPELD